MDAAPAQSAPGDKKPAAGAPDGDQEASNFRLIARLLAMTWRYRFGCMAVVLLHMVMYALGLMGLTAFGIAMDVFRHQVLPDKAAPRFPFGLQPPAGWSPLAVVCLLASVLLVSAALIMVLQYVTSVVHSQVAQNIVVDMRRQVYDKLQRLSFRFFDASSSASLINRVTSDVQSVRMFMDRVVVQVILVGIILVTNTVYMLNLHVKLTLWCLITVPLMTVAAIWFSRTIRPRYRQTRKLSDSLVLHLNENIQGVHVVKCFGRQKQEAAKFQTANAQLRDQRFTIFGLTSVFMPGMGVLTHINMAILLGYGGHLVMTDPAFTFGGGLIVFTGLLGGFASQVSQISSIVDVIQRSLTGAQRVFEVMDTPIEIASPARPRRLDVVRGEVRFEHVSFAYKPADPVLSDIHFRVEPHQCVAVLGATGSGKSTLLSLIPRFYDPDQGRVLLDGVDVRDMELDQLRRSIGLVFQESFLFSNTIAANIAFGHPEATRQQIEEAARIAAADEFIQELEHGYDTVIGEHGYDLSGGQRQRLAIARAVLLQPPILLLDDATSAVDPETEHEILQAMDNAMKGRTTFVVAHRLSTLRRADFIVVLDKGRIVQIGQHHELMNVRGQYRQAATLQVADDESRRLLGVDDDPAAPRPANQDDGPGMDEQLQDQEAAS